MNAQVQEAIEQRGPGELDDMFSRGDTWDVPAEPKR